MLWKRENITVAVIKLKYYDVGLMILYLHWILVHEENQA